ncbi:MAG: GNAT family N-acetyltransferase [Chloroflexi bacterium]|nr:GNAT family N-acetyltransferase [Chloroflexota bacterium]
MPVEITEQCLNRLRTYGSIPISFTVDSKYRVDAVGRGRGAWRLTEESVDHPYVKDYDEGGERPLRWAQQFDLSNWVILAALQDSARLGGAVVAWNTPGVNMLEDREDLAVLWDVRVHPRRRREGIGKRLFDHAAAWARAKGCRQLKVETQNINVPACKFYAKQGCYLGAVQPGAYPEYPNEVRLLWYLDL